VKRLFKGKASCSTSYGIATVFFSLMSVLLQMSCFRLPVILIGMMGIGAAAEMVRGYKKSVHIYRIGTNRYYHKKDKQYCHTTNPTKPLAQLRYLQKKIFR
jgi:hypothetical protein